MLLSLACPLGVAATGLTRLRILKKKMNKNFRTNQTKHWVIAFLLLLLAWQEVLGAGRKIDKIIFSKVDFKGDQSLEEIINSKEGRLYEPRLVKLDRILLTNYFKNYGFLNVDVRDSVVLDPRKNRVKRIIDD